MITYLNGTITFQCPTYVIIECGGIGYQVNISLNTYSAVQGQEQYKLFTYFDVKEDSQTLYGFATQEEKDLFTDLISVSGIGPSMGRMTLSSHSPQEIKQAIIQDNVSLIKGIKGIGPKSAKRIILELKDKLKQDEEAEEFAAPVDNTWQEEALQALMTLGFNKNDVDKVVRELLASDSNIGSIEDLIKKSLKKL
jgi:Holliday junction DNA helicase RuvA